MARPEITGKGDLADNLLWGVQAIADFIGNYLIKRCKLPVRKLSHRVIVASRRELRAALLGGE